MSSPYYYVSRLLAQTCELCGDTDGPFEVHHIRRLSDLNQPGRQNKPIWVKIMASRRRKTIVVCVRYHEDIHRVRTAKDQER
ncbi:RNA-directed DNA polymerase [Yersinia enterocolitica]|nr:RNA-directed DNA polymerase [Yersinia enterocolitica]